MSDNLSITGYGARGAAAYGSSAARGPTKEMTQEDFLALLVKQMTNQDPLQPDANLDFMNQLTSFTALEQTRQMVADLSALRLEQSMLQANALIGRTVEIDVGEGISWFGTVSSVQVVEGSPKVAVGGRLYDLSQLKQITLPGAPA